MDADVQKAFDDLRSQVADITKAVTTFTKKEPEESDDVKQLRADNAALKEKADAADKDKANFARQGINAIFDEAVTAKKITPAQRELFSKQLGIDDDKRVVELKQEDVRTMVGVIAKEDGKDKTNGGQAFTRQDGGNDEGYDKNKADEEVGRRVRALQATTQGLTFSRAMEQVLRDDKELATAYRDVTRNRSSATV